MIVKLLSDRVGFHYCNGSIRQVLCLAFVLGIFSGAHPAHAAPPAPDPRFGAVEAHMLPDAAASLRPGWDRLRFDWGARQPASASDWEAQADVELYLQRAALDRREAVGLLIGTPAWATDSVPGSGIPRNLYGAVDDPANVWANFVRRTVTQYAGIVNHWIVWNEPDIAAETSGAQFGGTVEDYYQLVKVAYTVAKAANPQAVLHLAGLTYWHDVESRQKLYLQRYLEVARQEPAARANRFYFDVLSLHIYFRTESVSEIIGIHQSLLRNSGIAKPIWVNELNAPPMDDLQSPWPEPRVALTLQQQADFIWQAVALSFSSGAERVSIYRLADILMPPAGHEPYGLFRVDGSPRPAALAYQQAIRLLSGFTTVAQARSAAVQVVVFNRPGSVTRVLWARGGDAVTVRLRQTPGTQSAQLFNALGEEQALPAGRLYRLVLAPASREPHHQYAVGGTPLILVEQLALPRAAG